MLNEILGKNPFKDLADKWRELILEDTDADFSKIEGRRFLLPGDSELEQYTRDDDATRLWPQIVPQPFIGDPRAKTWLVLINPGFTLPDYYDYCGIGDELKNLVMSGLKSKQQKIDFSYRYEDEDERCAFETRVNFLMDQLKLDIVGRSSYLPFYPIHECFNTIDAPGVRELVGTNKWWKASLCYKNKNAVFYDAVEGLRTLDPNSASERLGGELFVIEYFPYHSKEMNRNLYHYDDSHPYKAFVDEMLGYASCKGKRILFRSENELNETNLKSGNIWLLRTPQRVFLTESNLNRRGQTPARRATQSSKKIKLI